MFVFVCECARRERRRVQCPPKVTASAAAAANTTAHQLLGAEDLDVAAPHVRLVLVDRHLDLQRRAQHDKRLAREAAVALDQEDVDRLAAL